MEKKASAVVEGEKLDLLFGSCPREKEDPGSGHRMKKKQ